MKEFENYYLKNIILFILLFKEYYEKFPRTRNI